MPSEQDYRIRGFCDIQSIRKPSINSISKVPVGFSATKGTVVNYKGINRSVLSVGGYLISKCFMQSGFVIFKLLNIGELVNRNVVNND